MSTINAPLNANCPEFQREALKAAAVKAPRMDIRAGAVDFRLSNAGPNIKRTRAKAMTAMKGKESLTSKSVGMKLIGYVVASAGLPRITQGEPDESGYEPARSLSYSSIANPSVMPAT